MKKQTYQYGAACEKVALNFLRLKGYSILSSRYKTQFGEIDIIARRSKTVVFVEVKARKKNELIEVILRPKQIERIKKTAEFFLAQNPQFQNYDVRFDFILFAQSIFLQHHEAYFE